MRPSLFPSDESLPTWLHTVLLILIVSPFAAPLFWIGFDAITTAYLEPLSGPDFGQFFFGNLTLQGKAAKIAGVALVTLGCSYAALAMQFSRLAYGNIILRCLPWALLVIFEILSLWVKSLTSIA